MKIAEYARSYYTYTHSDSKSLIATVNSNRHRRDLISLLYMDMFTVYVATDAAALFTSVIQLTLGYSSSNATKRTVFFFLFLLCLANINYWKRSATFKKEFLFWFYFINFKNNYVDY